MSTALATTSNENQALARIEQPWEMSVQAVVARKQKIDEVMKSVMREGEHYGKIPGCGDKPTLLKAGAEMLCFTFGLTPTFEIRRADFPGGHREYEITCTLWTIATNVRVGQGLGSCSTMESKYRWHQGQRKCPSCGSTSAVRKSKDKPEWFCWRKKDGCGDTFVLTDPRIANQSIDRIENPDIANVYNTVLKIATKRALVAVTLTAVGASDVMTQDLEDMPADTRGPERPPYVRDEVQDAEFADVARSFPTEPSPEDLAQKAREDELNATARELITDIESATSEESVRALARRCNAIPKGTRARTAVFDCFHQRLEAVTQPTQTPPPVA